MGLEIMTWKRPTSPSSSSTDPRRPVPWNSCPERSCQCWHCELPVKGRGIFLPLPSLMRQFPPPVPFPMAPTASNHIWLSCPDVIGGGGCRKGKGGGNSSCLLLCDQLPLMSSEWSSLFSPYPRRMIRTWQVSIILPAPQVQTGQESGAEHCKARRTNFGIGTHRIRTNPYSEFMPIC